MLEVNHSLTLVIGNLNTKIRPQSLKDSITTEIAVRVIVPNQEPLHFSLERIMLQVVLLLSPQPKISCIEPRPTPEIPK